MIVFKYETSNIKRYKNVKKILSVHFFETQLQILNKQSRVALGLCDQKAQVVLLIYYHLAKFIIITGVVIMKMTQADLGPYLSFLFLIDIRRRKEQKVFCQNEKVILQQMMRTLRKRYQRA